MATTNSPELAGLQAVSPSLVAPGKWYGKLRQFEAVVPLAGQAAGDEINLFVLPAGFRPVFGLIQSSPALGSATIMVGTAASPARFRAAQTVALPDTPLIFGTVAGMSAVLAAPEQVKATVSAAALPGSGAMIIRIIGAGAE